MISKEKVVFDSYTNFLRTRKNDYSNAGKAVELSCSRSSSKSLCKMSFISWKLMDMWLLAFYVISIPWLCILSNFCISFQPFQFNDLVGLPISTKLHLLSDSCEKALLSKMARHDVSFFQSSKNMINKLTKLYRRAMIFDISIVNC